MHKEGKCKKCGKYSEKLWYYKGFWYCGECYEKLTSHMKPFSEVFD